jgi:hypothetical protein
LVPELFRLKSKRLELPAPFGRHVAEPPLFRELILSIPKEQALTAIGLRVSLQLPGCGKLGTGDLLNAAKLLERAEQFISEQ